MNLAPLRRALDGPTGTEDPATEAVTTAVQATPRMLHLPDGVCATFVVVGYPAEVGLGWLEPLLTYPGHVDVALHIEPIPPQAAADRLRRQLARLESSSQIGTEQGRVSDFDAQAAADAATDMAADLARGREKLFRIGLSITVHAASEDELDAEISQVQALASSLLLDARPATFRQLHGWVTTSLPLAVDRLHLPRTMHTSAASAAFPFTSPDLPATSGPTSVVYGANLDSASIVAWDRFACDNYNSVILARSGAGKSYLAKLEALRLLYAGVEVTIIDPEDEYARLTEAVGGSLIQLGAPGVHLNPLDLPANASQIPDALTNRQLFTHTMVGVLLGDAVDPASRAALDRAIVTCYANAGITPDPRSWNRPAPLLADLVAALEADEGDPRARELAARLAPYVSGTWRGLFEQPTTTRPEGHLVTFSLRELPDELATVGAVLALDATWRRITNPADRRPRVVVVDEGWLLLRDGESARYLWRLAKAARKYWTGLTMITQDIDDVLGSDLGQAVINNATTQILLRQAPQALDRIAGVFQLSEGERRFLASAGRGEGLLAADRTRVAFTALASAAEHELCTSDPAELARLSDEANRA